MNTIVILEEKELPDETMKFIGTKRDWNVEKQDLQHHGSHTF